MGLVIIASWIDDNLIIGQAKNVQHTKHKLMERFDCEDCVEFDELLG